MDIRQYMLTVGSQARAASALTASASTNKKNMALQAMVQRLDGARQSLLDANARDLHEASNKGLDAALLDRLELNSAGIDAMLVGLQQVAALADPVGAITDLNAQPSGIQVGKMRVPLGVVGIIYESRPNVTVDAASLCLKSGNACILRGGSEAAHSNQAIVACVQGGLVDAGLP